MNYDTSIFYGYPVSDGCYFWTSAKFYEDYRDSFDAGFIHRPFVYCGFNDPTVVACCYVPTTNRPQIIFLVLRCLTGMFSSGLQSLVLSFRL